MNDTICDSVRILWFEISSRTVLLAGIVMGALTTALSAGLLYVAPQTTPIMAGNELGKFARVLMYSFAGATVCFALMYKIERSEEA